MIRKILTYYAERLEEYLSRTHRRPEGLATVGMIGNSTEERLRPRARQQANAGVQAFLPRLPCRTRFRPADFRGRGRPRRTQLDARGLQTSRRQAAAQTVLLDDTRKILSHDGLTL